MATVLTAENEEYVPKKWEEVACPFCGDSQFKLFEKFGYQHRYRYVRCDRCHLVYQNPRPFYDQSFTETAYEVYATTNERFHTAPGDSGAARGSGDRPISSTPIAGLEGLNAHGKIVYEEYAYNLKEIESMVEKPGNLLEIGCNTGFFSKVAQDRGWRPVGVEISKTMAELAHRNYGFETRSGDWMNMQFDRKFDAIYCSHVIEHIPHPAAWLERMKEVLAPGGIICLSVPNMNSIDRKFKRVLKNLGIRKDRWEKWRTPDHLYEPSEESFVPFVQGCGFKIEKKYSYPSEWTGRVNLRHHLIHFKFRTGAKSRYYLRPVAGVN